MPWRCCVPGCRSYDEARSMGVVFHGLPTRDPQRCRTWLSAIRNPRYDENTPASRYSGVRVCSLHFTPDDYEEDFRARILNVAPKPLLKSGAVPSVFPGRGASEPGAAEPTPPPAPKRSRTRPTCGAASSSSPPPASGSEDSLCIVVSLDEFSSVTASDEESDRDGDGDGDLALVHTRSLMQLFRTCQTCGQAIVDKQLVQSGAQLRVRWSCHGGHSGTWKSSPRLRDAPP